MRPTRRAAGIAVIVCSCASAAMAADNPAFTRKEDVVYGRKDGTALTMDVFTPKENANGKGVIMVMSGGWVSNHDGIEGVVRNGFFTTLLQRGYTIFAVVHGSNPRYTIPEVLQDMHRAVRFIRYHAKDYGIDPDAIGIMGASAGGHLSLMQGTAGNGGNAKAVDPVDRVSSRVQAVGCFFPPTDFLNYGKPGANAIGEGVLHDFKSAFAFREMRPRGSQRVFAPIVDQAEVIRIGKEISPINHVSSDDPPTLIIHGDADFLVPIQQAEIFLAKLKSAGVDTKLITKPKAGHGWANLNKDFDSIADWFDEHLKSASASSEKK